MVFTNVHIEHQILEFTYILDPYQIWLSWFRSNGSYIFLNQDSQPALHIPITNLSISRANWWRVVYVLNYLMACSIYYFNKYKCDKVTILSLTCSPRYFLKPFINNNSFELSSDNTLLVAITICNSTSTCLTFWPSIILA